MEYYLYNNTANKLIFNDVGFEINSNEYAPVSQTIQKSYYPNCSIDDAIDNNNLLLSKNDDNNPPLEEHILSTIKAKYILSRSDSAFQVHFFDNININADNVQDAIENINTSISSDLLFAKVEEKRPQGVHGGDFVSGEWRTRNLNTITFDEIGIDLNNHIITLPVGKYYIEGWALGYLVENHQIRIFSNIKTKLGTSANSRDFSRGSPQTYSFASDIFVFDSETDIQLQHICSQTRNNYGLGLSSNLNIEIYSKIQIWKL